MRLTDWLQIVCVVLLAVGVGLVVAVASPVAGAGTGMAVLAVGGLLLSLAYERGRS